MKLIMPNDELIKLDTSLDVKERILVVSDILRDWSDHFCKYWNNNKVKICLDILSSYIVFCKEDDMKNKEDKEILSQKKVRRMQKGDSKISNFSNLSAEQRSEIGIEVE